MLLSSTGCDFKTSSPSLDAEFHAWATTSQLPPFIDYSFLLCYYVVEVAYISVCLIWHSYFASEGVRSQCFIQLHESLLVWQVRQCHQWMGCLDWGQWSNNGWPLFLLRLIRINFVHLELQLCKMLYPYLPLSCFDVEWHQLAIVESAQFA